MTSETHPHPTDQHARGEAVAAWRAFCERLALTGERLLDTSFAAGGDDRAEGVHHLANQVACWLTYGLGSADPERPFFFRSSDPNYAWGGPNVDQVARRAQIVGSGQYRVSGRMGACEEFVVQIKTGAAQTGGAEVALEIYASELGLGPGDDFSFVLDPDGIAPPEGAPAPGESDHAGSIERVFRLDPEATFVHVRDYYYDWQPAEPATFVIERLDPVPAPEPATTASVAALLDVAGSQVEHSMGFWRDYQDRLRAQQTINEFGAPAFNARGVQDIMYSHAFVRLGPTECLVVTLDPADAEIWGTGLYNRVWYEPLDHVHRAGSLNHRQVVADADGLVRVVIAGSDPGTANWLDSQGRTEVLATVRWLRPPAQPSITAVVTTRQDLRSTVPDTHPTVSESDRRSIIRARAAHAGWRYRT